MFTGIIECTGKVEKIDSTGTNKTFWISSPISEQLKVDQSIAHNGVCLTVESIKNEQHQITAIAETLSKTNLNTWKVGSEINLERCLQIGARLDGHIVQGHVDTTAICTERIDLQGSYEFRFSFEKKFAPLIIEKGSVCVNGISLTAFNIGENHFSVAIIPYTFEHTNIKDIQPNSTVNVEFDIVGKYVARGREMKQE